MMPPAQPPGPPYASGTYEFGDAENATFRALVGTMRVAAALTLVQGICSVAQAVWLVRAATGPQVVGAAIGGLISLVLQLFLSLWTFSAAAAFDRVVGTVGNDIPNLMTAIDKLRQLFAVLRVLCIVLLAFIALACVAGMMLALRVAH